MKVLSDGHDRCGRTIGEIYHLGTLINRVSVAARMAWHYVKYTPDDIALAEAQKHARELKTGLWSGSHKVIAPWDWRKINKYERVEWY